MSILCNSYQIAFFELWVPFQFPDSRVRLLLTFILGGPSRNNPPVTPPLLDEPPSTGWLGSAWGTE